MRRYLYYKLFIPIFVFGKRNEGMWLLSIAFYFMLILSHYIILCCCITSFVLMGVILHHVYCNVIYSARILLHVCNFLLLTYVSYIFTGPN